MNTMLRDKMLTIVTDNPEGSHESKRTRSLSMEPEDLLRYITTQRVDGGLDECILLQMTQMVRVVRHSGGYVTLQLELQLDESGEGVYDPRYETTLTARNANRAQIIEFLELFAPLLTATGNAHWSQSHMGRVRVSDWVLSNMGLGKDYDDPGFDDLLNLILSSVTLSAAN